MRGKKLSRQFRKTLESENFEGELSLFIEQLKSSPGLSENSKLKMLENAPQFLDSVEAAYEHYELLLDVANRSLELSSRELNEANRLQAALNQSIRSMVNSLGQGYLAFGNDGICFPTSSKACETLLEGNPAGKFIGDVLKISEAEREGFAGWIKILFTSTMDFDDLADLGPKIFPHSQNRFISLEFKPMRGEGGILDGVVIIATDRTDEREAMKKAEERLQYSNMIIKLTKDRNEFFSFVKELRRMIGILRNAQQVPSDQEIDLPGMKRVLHTVKGAALSFYMTEIRNQAHQFETELSNFEKNDPPQSRADLVRKLETCASSLEVQLEIFLSIHERLLGTEFEKRGHIKEVPMQDLYDFGMKLGTLPGGQELERNFLESVVAVSIRKEFSHFDRDIQLLARIFDKRIKPIQFHGEDVRVLLTPYSSFFSFMVHVFNNAIDHGLETEAERIKLGKSPDGLIKVTLSREKSGASDWISILVEDDGRGIDVEALRKKLLSQKCLDAESVVNDDEVMQHIFDDGLSTKNAVTETSGRGVGLSAVRAEVQRLGGTVSVKSVLEKGTTFLIRVPMIWEQEQTQSPDSTFQKTAA